MNLRKRISGLHFLALFSIGNTDAQPWLQQPILSLDAQKNIVFRDPSTNKSKTIFPVMLYSFKDTTEADNSPLPTHHFWHQAHRWGFNIVFSWNENIEKQSSFLQSCNTFSKLCMLTSRSWTLPGSMFAFPDEPISFSPDFDSNYFNFLKSKNGKKLAYLNNDLYPYFYRLSRGARSGFSSKIPMNNSGSTASISDLANFAEILAFDYYPYQSNGKIDNLISNIPWSPKFSGTITVGEFTDLLKNRYPEKAIWPIIQTLWYTPMDAPFQGYFINDIIIRQLTFDAIIHGADGVSFFGHGQTVHFENDPRFKFLQQIKDSIWKSTLYVTKELQELQEKHHQILLQDNVGASYVKTNDVAYCYKQVPNSNIYYVFIINRNSKVREINVKIPTGMSLVPGSLRSIGRYYMPDIPGICPSIVRDYRNPKAIGKVSSDHRTFSSTLFGYGTNIISMSLTK